MKTKKVKTRIKEGRRLDLTLPIYDSMAQCAGATKIPLDIIKRSKREGCTAIDGSSRVHLGKLLEWIFNRDDSNVDWTAYGKKFQALNEEARYNKASGAVVDRDAVTGGIQEAMAVLFATLDRLFTSELPASAKGLDEIGIRAKAAGKITELKTVLREKFAAIGKVK